MTTRVSVKIESPIGTLDVSTTDGEGRDNDGAEVETNRTLRSLAFIVDMALGAYGIDRYDFTDALREIATSR